MPINGNIRAMSAMAGFGLLCTALVLCYLNSKTASTFWSAFFIVNIVITVVAIFTKWSIALGYESKRAFMADKCASVVPFIAVAFNVLQLSQATHDGLDGFMAGFSIISLGFVIGGGITDAFVSLCGDKYRDLSAKVTDTIERSAAAADAFKTGRRG